MRTHTFAGRFAWLCMIALMGTTLAACGGSGGDGTKTPEPVACASKDDCAANEICYQSFCKVPDGTENICQTNADCPALQYCDMLDKTCKPFSETDGDADADTSSCTSGASCTQRSDCRLAGLLGHACVNGCCVPDSATNCLVDGCDDHYTCNTDSLQCDPGPDHCLVVPCLRHQTCDETSGVCSLDDDHCSKKPCGEQYTCNTTTGECDQKDTHCSVAGCPNLFACDETTGLCSPGPEHCTVKPCGALFTCKTETGVCEPTTENCAVTPCGEHFACDTASGECKPDATHCDNVPCAAHYACNQEKGVCEAGPDHCSVTPCTDKFVCNTESGVCDPGPEHCSNKPCGTNFRCKTDTGACEATSQNCVYTGCEPHYACDTVTNGTCAPDSTHCSVTGCGAGLTCNPSSGRCWPSANVCTKNSCPGNNFMCEGSAALVDCEEYCWDNAYPYFPSATLCKSSGSGSSITYDCYCENYDDNVGTCAAPVVIDRLPYKHHWNMDGGGKTLTTGGCQQTGGTNPTLPAWERVYSLTVKAGETYRIDVQNDTSATACMMCAVKPDPVVSVRDVCANSPSWSFCKSASGSIGGDVSESYSVTFPQDGTYYIVVQDPSYMTVSIITVIQGSYTLSVTRQ